MEYCIANKQYSKEKYFELLATFDIQKLQKESRAWLKKQSKRSFQGVNVENAVGNEIYNLKNAFYCFECYDGENLRYCSNIKTGSNCMDVSNFGWHPEWCYECCVTGHNAQNILFGYDVWLDVSNMIYCQNCRTSQDCFASSGLHNHEHHCILNKPYSIHEYEVLCGKIIDHMISTGEWGEFFDPKLSRFGYNETLAMDYFPLTQDAVRAYGWNWYTEEEKVFSGSSYVPLSLSQYDERVVGYDIAQKNIDECLGGIIQCEATGKPFKIIKQELIFYIENSLPLPTKHPNQRHKERTQLRNPRTLYERHCADCNTDIITTYSPDRPERVVCEECYRKIVY